MGGRVSVLASQNYYGKIMALDPNKSVADCTFKRWPQKETPSPNSFKSYHCL